MKTKKCTKCKNKKKITEFCKNSRAKDGRASYCRSCKKKLYSARYTIEERREKRKIAYTKNREKELAKNKEWAENNKIKRSKKAKEWYNKNKDKLNAIDREKCKDPAYKAKKNLRRRILHGLKDNTKSASTIELLGCSVEEFMIYMENKFLEGMTWDNHGVHGWHIDHIKPCASFDLSDPEQQKICFHYSNLQPLWAKDNIKKSDKIIF